MEERDRTQEQDEREAEERPGAEPAGDEDDALAGARRDWDGEPRG